MAIDLDDIFRRGGKELLDVLNYCARSAQMDPVFAFLAQEYRLFPSHAKAVALYDIFVAPDAPARIDALALLPPRELALQKLIENLRGSPANRGLAEPAPPKPQVAGKHIFDALDLHVRKNRRGAIARIKRRYNLKLTPTENLPGGRMTPGQKRFVDQVWEPRIRPTLVAAGFPPNREHCLTGIGNAVAAAVIEYRRNDGANQHGDMPGGARAVFGLHRLQMPQQHRQNPGPRPLAAAALYTAAATMSPTCEVE